MHAFDRDPGCPSYNLSQSTTAWAISRNWDHVADIRHGGDGNFMDLVVGVSNDLTLDTGLLTYLTGTTHPAFWGYS